MRNLPRISKNISKQVISPNHFQNLLQAIFLNGINLTSNAGQVAILEENYEKTSEVFQNLMQYGKQITVSIVKAVAVVSIGSEKFNAIENIYEVMAEQIVQAWDDSIVSDQRTTVRLFNKTDAGDYLVNSASENALRYGYRAKLISGLL